MPLLVVHGSTDAELCCHIVVVRLLIIRCIISSKPGTGLQAVFTGNTATTTDSGSPVIYVVVAGLITTDTVGIGCAAIVTVLELTAVSPVASPVARS
jgi:hypothetical protein